MLRPAQQVDPESERLCIAAEALLAEIIGNAGGRDARQARVNRRALALHLAQEQLEAIAGQCAARKLAVVPAMVEHAQVNDARAEGLAGEIARRIEKELQYPGQIRVTVIRETRAVDYAK